MAEPAPRRGLRILDLAALVVGYGMAALLIRASWPPTRAVDGANGAALALAYLWLGLAMSGPVVLLPRPAPADGTGAGSVGRPPRYTGAEMAWLGIGGYWIVLTFAVAAAHSSARPLPLLAAIQFMAGMVTFVLWCAGRRPSPGESWTHRAAVGLLATWPLAWADLIFLSLG